MMLFKSKVEARKGLGQTREALGYVSVWRKTILAFNVAKWKRGLVKSYFPHHRLIFLPLNTTVYKKEFLIRMSRSPVFLVWGMNEPFDLKEFSEEFDIPIIRIEDGFFRSIGLGANHVLPYSFCIDHKGIYYDSTKESDLEYLIKNYDWDNDKEIIERSSRIIDIIRSEGFSKYNEVSSNIASSIYGPKTRKRILVIGQVEDDQSLLYGSQTIISNLDLVKLALKENSGAQVIYKPHPDVMHGRRKELSDIEQVKSEVEVLSLALSLKDALYGVDHVYTMTSLAGFEALIHGVSVTTIGAPFYSGWGLTDDRYDTGRRRVERTLEQVFAAAYLLYPEYRHPETRKKITIEEVIEEFRETLLENKPLEPEEVFDRSAFYNLATHNKVSPLLIKKSSSERCVVITDTKEPIDIINGLAKTGKEITVYATRDNLANDESFLYPLSIYSNVNVMSIHKAFSFAFSEIERDSVILAKSLAKSIEESFSLLELPFLDEALIKSFCQGFEGYIYFDVVRYFSGKIIVNEFDSILLNISDKRQGFDIFGSVYFNAEKEKKLGKVFFSSGKYDGKDFIAEFLELKKKTNKKEKPSFLNVRELVSSYWWSLQSDNYIDQLNEGFKYVVCGNLNNENYAYLPASLNILNSLVDRDDGTISFVNSSFGNENTQNEVKSVILSEFKSKNIKIYQGSVLYRDRYSLEVFEKKDESIEAFFDLLISSINNRFSKEFVMIYEERVKRFLSNCFDSFIFISEAKRILEKADVFITSMEGSMTSRILVALAKSNNVKTIGIQPQIISTSPRYTAPTVDFMGAIDSIQKENYKKLGYKENKIIQIGSVNIIDRIKLIQEYESVYEFEEDSILFAMQHSASKEMINTAYWLMDIAEKNQLTIYIKPHPHQELSVLNEVKRIVSKYRKAYVLNRDSDTYEYIAKSFAVVGLFSSVLYEAGIHGKMVVVATLDDVDESIDFTKYGLALRAKNKTELEKIILDFKSQGESYFSLKNRQKEYIKLNPQFASFEKSGLVERLPL